MLTLEGACDALVPAEQTDGGLDGARDAGSEAGSEGACERPTIELPISELPMAWPVLRPVALLVGVGGLPLKASRPKRVPAVAGAK